MDHLEISSLRIKTSIGVHAWEQRILQLILVDISIPLESQERPDLLSSTIDYDTLCRQLITEVESKSFQLIETLADYIATFIKQLHPQVRNVSIRVSKPYAVPEASNVSVHIVR